MGQYVLDSGATKMVKIWSQFSQTRGGNVYIKKKIHKVASRIIKCEELLIRVVEEQTR